MTTESRQRSRDIWVWLRVGLAVAVTIAVVWFVASGAHRGIDAGRIRDELLALGAWGPVAFVMAFAALQPFGIPSHFFIVGAGLVWSPVLAFFMSLLAALLAQLHVFMLCRYLLRSWAQRHVPERFRRYDTLLMRRPIRTILGLRLLVFTSPLFTAALALSKLPAWPIFVGSALGVCPGIVLDIYLGEGILAWFGRD